MFHRAMAERWAWEPPVRLVSVALPYRMHANRPLGGGFPAQARNWAPATARSTSRARA
jgi:hypothetical protein